MILASGWQAGGPMLPLEFARDSDDSEELAIVIADGAALMPTYWALMETGNLEEAREQLRQREKVSVEHPEWIGSVPAMEGQQTDPRMASWLSHQPFDAVIWTALPPKFNGIEGRAPSAEEALTFLSLLTGPTRDKAEEYIRRIPADIMTPYRKRFEEALSWTALPVLQDPA